MTKTEKHKAICEELHALYVRKNHDYGDSFHRSFQEYGLLMLCIRLDDKLNRFKTLSRGAERQVADETIRDTLLDIANYAGMGVMELEELQERVPAVFEDIGGSDA